MLSELLQNETKEDENGERGIDMLKIIYEDHDILVAEKPAGLESQASRGFEPDMVSEIKNHLKRAELSRLSTKPSTKSSTRPVEPYLGVIHRLDKPVGGIMVYAKNQKAAASLSKQVQDGRMKKIYNAVVCGKLVDIVGNYVDYLLKDGTSSWRAFSQAALLACISSVRLSMAVDEMHSINSDSTISLIFMV